MLIAATRLASAQPSEPVPPPPTDAPAPPPVPVPPPPREGPPPPANEPPSLYDECMTLRRRLTNEAMGTDDPQEKMRLLTSRPECRPDMTALPRPAAVAAEEPEAEASVVSGFALELRFESGLYLISSSSALPATQGGIFIGYRGKTATLGIGIDFGRVTESMDDPTIGSMSRSSNMVLVSPGIRVVLARSRDEKTELLGQADVGLGSNWQSDDTMSSSSPSTSHFRVQLAPGLRYWVSPSFAVGGAAGFRYDLLTRDSNGFSSSLSTTGMFGALALTGVF